MTYSKQTWVDLDVTKPLSDDRMGHIEDGLEQVDLDVQAEAVTARAAEAAEITARGTAITTAIATEVSNRNTAITTAVGTETTNRAAADVALDARLDALERNYRITTDLTRNTVVFADMVGLTAIAVDASSHYEFELMLNVAVSVTAASGVQVIMVAATTALSNVLSMGWFPAGGNPGVDAFYETCDPCNGTIGPSPGTNPGIDVVHPVRVIGSFDTNGTAGTIKWQGRISTVTGGGTATFKTGSILKLRKIVPLN